MSQDVTTIAGHAVTHTARSTANDPFDTRARQLLQAVAASPFPQPDDIQRRLALYSIARLALGIHSEQAFADLAAINRDPGNSWMFLWHSNADAYCRFGKLYPSSLREIVRRQMTSHRYEVHNGHTENHRLMIATGGYLASQAFADWPQAGEVNARSRQYLLDFFERVRRFGQGEYAATTYGVLYLNTLASLASLANDPAMRRCCVTMLDWFLAGFAGLWLRGRLTGAHSRDTHPICGMESVGAAEVALWLYFGGSPNVPSAREPHYSIMNALCDYRPPEWIVQMANDRDEAYEQIETHDLTSLDAPTHDDNVTSPVAQEQCAVRGNGYISREGVRKYTFMDERYALGSVYDGRSSQIVWGGQARRWSMDMVSGRSFGSFFFTHPVRDGAYSNDTYWRSWVGSSPYEQVLQHRSTLIALYNIPRGGTYKAGPRPPIAADEFPFIDGFISYEAFGIVRDDPSGWVFVHGGAAMLAFRTIRPGRWVSPGDGAPIERGGGRSWYRSEGLRNAVLVETAESAWPSPASWTDMSAELDGFAERILTQTQIDASQLDTEHPSIAYTDTHGHRLHIEFDGVREIDGKAMDFSQWPLLRNRWVESRVGIGGLNRLTK